MNDTIVHKKGVRTLFVDYVFLFADIQISSLASVWPPSVYLLNVPGFHKLVNGPLDRRDTAFDINGYSFVGRKTVLIFSLPVAQVSIDTLRCKGQVISEHLLVTFHR